MPCKYLVAFVFDVISMDEFVRQIGPERIMNENMIDKLFARLTPKQRKELLRRLQETQPKE